MDNKRNAHIRLLVCVGGSWLLPSSPKLARCQLFSLGADLFHMMSGLPSWSLSSFLFETMLIIDDGLHVHMAK